MALTGLIALAAASACSTGSPLALEPAVDVGVSTATVAHPSAAAYPVPAPASAPVLEDAVEQALASIDPAEPMPEPPASSPVTATSQEELSPAVGSEPARADDESDTQPVDTGLLPQPPALPDPVLVEPAIEPQARPTRVAALPRSAPPRGMETLVPSNPTLVSYPRMSRPVERPSGLSADDVACRRDLKKLGVAFRELAPINDGGSCRIDHPVLVSAIGDIRMKPAATLNCEMAATFARWTKKELVPSARWRYLSGVKTIHQGSSYSCRKIAGTSVSSEHARGNALDVMRIELKDGKDIDVRKPGWFAFRQRGLLNNVRSDACDYFTTVLGPGYNYDHRNHFHFDIKPRKNGRRACR